MSILVTGAGGGLGLALVDHYLDRNQAVIAVSHKPSSPLLERAGKDSRLQLIECAGVDYSTRLLARLRHGDTKPSTLFHCSGLLHEPGHLPEKRLAQLEPGFLQRNLELNCQQAIYLAQALEALYERRDTFKLALLSARVGSIGDNRLGGWYSYRMTKAALNMFTRTLAIEWRRSLPNATVIALHPGTTDTPLSRPFQKNIPPPQLRSPAQSAERLARVMAELDPELSGDLLNWDGIPLPW